MRWNKHRTFLCCEECNPLASPCSFLFSPDNDNYSFCWKAFKDLSPLYINGFLRHLNPPHFNLWVECGHCDFSIYHSFVWNVLLSYEGTTITQPEMVHSGFVQRIHLWKSTRPSRINKWIGPSSDHSFHSLPGIIWDFSLIGNNIVMSFRRGKIYPCRTMCPSLTCLWLPYQTY